MAVKVYDFKADQPWQTLNMRVITGILKEKGAIGLIYSDEHQKNLSVYLNRHSTGFVKKRVGEKTWGVCLREHKRAVDQLLSMKSNARYFPTQNVLEALLENKSVLLYSLKEAQKLARAFYADEKNATALELKIKERKKGVYVMVSG